jgi:hypothetical protein
VRTLIISQQKQNRKSSIADLYLAQQGSKQLKIENGQDWNLFVPKH